jgi:SNF2 family DNA or RNA helicase
MFSGIKKFIGYVGVEETETHIIIEGLPGYDITKDIQNKWQTSKINTQMFTLISRSKIVFPKFFAIDILFIFNELYADRKVRTPKRLLERIIIELYERTWLKDITLDEKHKRINFSKLDEISFKMLPHQMDFLESYNQVVPSYRLNGLLLAAAPGSGKTLTCLAVASCVEADVVIAISPKNALERVWEATMRDNLTKRPEYWVSKVAGEQPPLGLRYYAFHYEALDRAVQLAERLPKGKRVCIILDECHNFNEINSTRTQLFIKLCEITKSKDVIWSSGTPVKAIGAECVPLLKTIDPFFKNKDTEERFRKIFGKDAKRANDILRNRIGIVSFKINKQEVVKGEVNYHEVKIQIPNGNYYTLETIRNDMREFIDERNRYYKSMLPQLTDLYNECIDLHKKTLSRESDRDGLAVYKKYIKAIKRGYDPILMKTEVIYCNKYELQKIIPSLPKALRKEFKSVRSVIKYLSLKIMGEALGGVLGKRRSQCHADMVPYMRLEELVDGAEKKTVIFTSYVEVVDKVADVVTEKGYQPIKVYGDTNKNLPSLIKQFDEKIDLNPLIATYQSLSTAVPLVMANNLIMTNAPFRDHEREQAIARCDRIGQNHTVHVHDIYLDTGDKANISTRSKDILEWSRDQVASIMGVAAPADLEAALEAMMISDVPLEVSQETFLESIGEILKTSTIR